MRNYCCRFINIIRENFMVPVYRVQSTDVAGGPVRRSRTFAVSQKRQKQNRRFCRDAVRPPDEAHPEAARLAAAYDLQGSRYEQTVSAETSCPSVQGTPRPQLRITHYELRIEKPRRCTSFIIISFFFPQVPLSASPRLHIQAPHRPVHRRQDGLR